MADLPDNIQMFNQLLAELNRLLTDRLGLSEEEIRVLEEKIEIEKITDQREKDAQEALKKQKEALDKSVQGIIKFYDALTDTSTKMTKYGSATNAMADVVGTLASARFPGLSTAIEAATSATKVMAEKVLKQTENIVKAFDEIAQIGGGARMSAEQISQLGLKAGFTNHNLEIFTRNARQAGSALVAMGGSTSKGMEAFSTFAAIGDEQLRKYRKLGLTQEQLIDMQTKYLDIQAKTGGAMARTPKELKDASLGYINNMLALAEITGKNLKQTEEAYAAALAQENFNAYKFAKERERDKLLAAVASSTDANERKRLQLQADNISGMLKEKELLVTRAQMIGGPAGTGIIEMAASDQAVLTESSAQLATIRGFQDVMQDLNRGLAKTDDVMNTLASGVAENTDMLGESAYAFGSTSRAVQGQFSLGNSLREFQLVQEKMTKSGMSFDEALSEVRNTAEKGKSTEEDRIMAGQAALEQLDRWTRRLDEAVVKAVNPFRTEVYKAALAAGGLAVAFGFLGSKIGNFPGGRGPGTGRGGGVGAGTEAETTAGGGPGAGRPGPGMGRLGRGLMMGAGAGALLGFGSEYAADALGRDTAAGMGLTTLGSAATGASIGAFLGPAGAAAGALIGTGVGLYRAFGSRAEQETAEKTGVSSSDIAKIIEAGPGFLVAKTADGKTIRREGNRNWRNNNPGNLEYGDYAKNYGAIGSDGRFAIFPNLEMGRKAKEDLLFGQNYVNRTIESAISRYAPPNENNTPAYIDAVTKATGTSPYTVLRDLSESQRQSFLAAVERVEGFKPGKIIEAASGGIASGPFSGYPATLHGNEMIQPLDPNSILEVLATTPVGQESSKLMNSALGSNTNTSQLVSVQASMIEMMSAKLDSVINQLEISNDIQDKMYKYASS